MNSFIEHSHVVTTIKYNIVTAFHIEITSR
jgi:hypothetical protein